MQYQQQSPQFQPITPVITDTGMSTGKKIGIVLLVILVLVALYVAATSGSTTTTETKTPEIKAPETKTPETKTPETKTPETKTPETKTPETKTPETKPPAIPSWKYAGCWNDNCGARVIPDNQGPKTLTQCKEIAAAKGYNIIGMQWGKPGQTSPPQCWIGKNVDYKSAGAGTTCGVYKGEGVGDGCMNSVYVFGTQEPVALTTSWKSDGCWKDSGYGRVIPEYVGDKSLIDCKASAISKNFNVIGMQWGKPGQTSPPQCWIGDNANYKALGSGETCGANANGEGVGDANMNSVYVLTS